MHLEIRAGTHARKKKEKKRRRSLSLLSHDRIGADGRNCKILPRREETGCNVYGAKSASKYLDKLSDKLTAELTGFTFKFKYRSARFE